MRSYRLEARSAIFRQEKTEKQHRRNGKKQEKKGRLRRVRSFQGHLFYCLVSLALSCLAAIIKNA